MLLSWKAEINFITARMCCETSPLYQKQRVQTMTMLI